MWQEKIIPIIYNGIKPKEIYADGRENYIISQCAKEICAYMLERPKEYDNKIAFNINDFFMVRQQPKELQKGIIDKLRKGNVIIEKSRNIFVFNRAGIESGGKPPKDKRKWAKR